MIDFLSVRRDNAGVVAPPGEGDLVDEVSGLRITPGTFGAVATTQHSDAAALVDRLGGFQPGATWAGRPVADPPLGLDQIPQPIATRTATNAAGSGVQHCLGGTLDRDFAASTCSLIEDEESGFLMP